MSFSIVFDTGDQILPTLNRILQHLHSQDQKMADFGTDLQDLKDTVAGIASGLTSVLDRLKNNNVTPDQITQFEQLVSSLHDVKNQLDAANVPIPAPTPDQPMPTPPTPDQPAPATPANAGA
jgi:uncharacterized phage infection (PIP) family protein YhgE